MKKMFKKISSSQAGFSLTEVMIGIMILTVAIVAATNLLISLIKTNETNLKHLQAYYFAVEGIEVVRNMRDTNWLLNENWLTDEDGGPWGQKFDDGNYSVTVSRKENFGLGEVSSSVELGAYAPFKVDASSDGAIVKFINDDVESGFQRKLEVLDYQYECGEKCADYKLIRVTVTWDGGPDEGVVLEEVLTNWKGGAL